MMGPFNFIDSLGKKYEFKFINSPVGHYYWIDIDDGKIFFSRTVNITDGRIRWLKAPEQITIEAQNYITNFTQKLFKNKAFI